jgi:hypothetical protein
MTLTAQDVHGPVDFVLLEFPGDRLTGEAGRALVDLVERDLIRVYDLMVISKEQDGSVQVQHHADPQGVEGFS